MTLIDEPSLLRRDRRDLNLRIILLLAASNIVLMTILSFVAYHRAGESDTKSWPPNVAVVAPLPLKPTKFHWKTPYSSENDTESDILWNAIDPAHGHIAVDHEWAAGQNWLPSMPVPGNETKGLYLLEAYHQLHCLKILRRVLLEAANGLPLSYPLQHARHCLDYNRQFVMCHADSTPLYTLGKHTAGDNQFHMCRDWNALREYATDNSACFRDRSGSESLREQFGHCDGGKDGTEAWLTKNDDVL